MSTHLIQIFRYLSAYLSIRYFSIDPNNVMIALYFVVLNLAKRLRDFLSQFLDWILILFKLDDFIIFGQQNRTVLQLA